MAVPEVNKGLFEQLEDMGFPFARATRALYYSGNSSLEDAITWIVDHENDPDIDQLLLVPLEIDLDSAKPFHITEEVKMKAVRLRNGGQQSRKKKEKESEREKARIQAGKELLEAKRITEENSRKRMIASVQVGKEEERTARQRIRQKLEADKAERRSKLGLPRVASPSVQFAFPSAQKKTAEVSGTDTSTKKVELLSNYLRSLRRNHKDDDARVRRAFQTLHVYVINVLKNPDVERFRKIRLTNPLFQEKVCSLTETVRFLELCGFERTNRGQILYLPREKVESKTLDSAITALHSAMSNPYFGLLSTELP